MASPSPTRALILAGIGLALVAGIAALILVPRPSDERLPPNPTAAPEHSTPSALPLVAAVGDSITQGAGEAPPDAPADRSYPAQLAELLGDGYEVRNYGLGGRTLLADGAMPYTEEPEYDASLESEPDIVVIMLGTNDSHPGDWDADAYRRELAAFATGYRELPSAPRVILMTPPAAYGDKDQQRIVAEETAPIVRETAQLLGVELIDIHAATTGHPEWFPDGLHPNAEGYGAIAGAVAAQIQSGG